MDRDDSALEQHGLRRTNQPEYHIRLSKQMYVRGDIEVDELERRVGLALEGLAVLEADKPDWVDVLVYPSGGAAPVRLTY